MSMEDAELGKLTRDHLYAHSQVTRQKAELEQIGENLILLGSNLRKYPQNIRIGEAKITLKDDQNQDRTLLWSTLDIADTFHIVEDLKQTTEREQQIAHQLREAGMGYIVDGLESKKPAPPDTLGQSG